MRKHALNLLKLLVAGLLVWFVLSKVEWSDRVEELKKDQDGKWVVADTIPGVIVGSWKLEEIRFHAEGEEGPKPIRPGPKEGDERRIEIRPGIPTVLKTLDIGLFLLGALCYFLVACFSAFRWAWLLRVNGLDVSPWRALRLTWIGIFFNNVVPGLTGGDVVKAVYVARVTGERTRPILSVLVDRVMGLIALAILAAIVVLMQFREFERIGTLIYAGLFALLVGVACFFSRRIRGLLKLDVLLSKLPMAGLLKKIDQAIYFYRGHLKGMLVWLLLSSLNHALGVVGVYLIGQALGLELALGAYLVLVPVINIATAVPIAPAGWGVGEYLFQTLFSGYAERIDHAQRAIMPTLSLVLSLVYRIHLMLWSLLGSVFLAFEKGRPTEQQVADLMDSADAEGAEGAPVEAGPGS